MSMRLRISAMVALAGIGLWAALAAAEVRVCNRFSLPVYVAIGYATTSDVKTEGLWLIQPDSCGVVDGSPVDGPYYIHAHTQWIEDGDGPLTRYRWGKGTMLAVDRRPFNFPAPTRSRPVMRPRNSPTSVKATSGTSPIRS